MSEIGMDLEFIRGWISTGFLGFIAFCVARVMPQAVAYLIRTRELRLQERKEEREGYGPLIEALQRDGKSLREEVQTLRTMLDTCREQHAKSDLKIAELEAYIKGSERAAVARSAHEMVELQGTPPHIRNVARATAKSIIRAVDKEPEQ